MSYYLQLTYQEGHLAIMDLATHSLEEARCLAKGVIRRADGEHTHERAGWINQATLLKVNQRLQVDLAILRAELREQWRRDMETQANSPEALAAERVVYERLKAKFEPPNQEVRRHDQND